MSVLHITDLRQLRGVSSNQTISIPVALLRERRPFTDMQLLMAWRRFRSPRRC